MSMKRIIYVPFDHLNRDYGVLKTADPATDQIVIVESSRMTSGRPWHKERLFFLISSARHFASELTAAGYKVRYIKAPTTIDGLKLAQTEFGALPICSAEPSSFVQFAQLEEFGVDFLPNDFFLTSRVDFELWAGKQKSFLMETFYRAQRLRLGIMIEDGKPETGVWNYDKENRLPPPKNYTWPKYLEHERDEIDLEVCAELGLDPTKTWATTRAGALAQLDHFIEHNLANFGPYEDAVSNDSWALHHSLLSPYLNNGLLHASEVIAAALVKYKADQAPIASVEAFVRQIIGWREYLNGMYWHLGADYKFKNGLNAQRKLLPLFQDSSKTKMKCMQGIVSDIETRAWTHHIPRLMILSNLALVTGVNPIEFLDWMREQFIDATEWVMVPNIIGMGLHADGGQLMTKPYAAGGAYISRMTQFCKGCEYDPKLRVGETACPFTTLYWDFLDRHKEEFAKNHRMSQQVAGIKRLSDLPELKVRAQEVLSGLDKGTI
ncbi:MAG: cryptochrome/photolyase family protein [Candidatus Nanopelagicales bacterium]|nr:cryptochrome/photolyase family protein [Candidatus Nanopelagicales bacterium]MDP4667041.1 cryptochrome/photolyase family protein [Candidatus Nanopelagicales bacterium]MDP4895718.1 cryptochrome/photolyase family protein [Candidatus Nanopelagicales bacterium]MDP5050554.1 cryptochrome/photolyase family protein [Candidatus Nanopelagicales bacterium]